MKMQIQRLKGKKGVVVTPAPTAETTPESAQPSSTSQPNGSGPQMQVAPQQKPQTTNPAPDNNRNATPSNPGAASYSPAAVPAQSASSGKNSVSANVPTTAQKAPTAPAKAQASNGTDAEAVNANSAASERRDSTPQVRRILRRPRRARKSSPRQPTPAIAQRLRPGCGSRWRRAIPRRPSSWPICTSRGMVWRRTASRR